MTDLPSKTVMTLPEVIADLRDGLDEVKSEAKSVHCTPWSIRMVLDEIERLQAGLERARKAMCSVTVFVVSREKIKHPEGHDWWNAEINAVCELLPVPSSQATGEQP